MHFYKMLKHRNANQIFSNQMAIRSLLIKIFNHFLNKNNSKKYSGNPALGAVFVETFNKTIRNLLKKPVSEKGNDDWISDLSSVIEQYNNTIHHSTKKTPIQASMKTKERIVHDNLPDKTKKHNAPFHISELVRAADIKKVFSKGDSMVWSYNLYTITEVIHNKVPSY